ncbi:uncharacterized protein LOC121847580 [Tachysurus ichikawai]
MGSECRHVYRHNLNLTDEQQRDIKTILDALEAYFKPARNVIYERYMFGCCKQEEGESIDNFVTRLREKATTCDYGGLKDEMIRDKIVLGIINEGTRRRLLSEKNLTLLTAIEMCRTAEQIAMHMRAMDAACMPTVAETVHTVARKPFRPNQRMQSNSPRLLDTSKTCRYCGNVHSRGRDYCPAFGKTCRLCGTDNHFAKVCLKSKSRSTEGKLHCIEHSKEPGGDSDDDIYVVESISTVHMKGKKWFVSLQLHGKSLPCQLDLGATCNVMSYKDKVKSTHTTPP